MRRRHFLMVVYFCLACAAPLSAQEAKVPAWQAGTARVVITPTHLMWMSGYGARSKPAEGRVHHLWAKALVLQDAQGRRLVLVSLDLVGIDRRLAEDICADVAKRNGIARDAIMLAVSHTHCGPVVGGNLLSMYQVDDKQKQLIEAYARDLHGKIVDLVDAAQSKMTPVQLSWGNGLTTFATNRRNNKEADVPKLRDLGQLKGPVDHEVPVLTVRDPQGTVKGIVFGYACHATVLSDYFWCGDYPGFAQLALEKRYPEATALFFAGCGADQNPLPRRSVELAENYGRQLADAVDQVIKAPMAAVSPTLKTSLAHVEIPFSELPTREKLMADLEGKDRYAVGRARLLLEELKRHGALKKTYPYPVQAWQLGQDLTWIALGGEVVVDYSLRLKKELGKVWVAGYTNDVMAYIPSLRVLKEGGYEGGTSMVYYGQPCPWGPAVEELIVEAVHRQVAAVRGVKK